TILVPSGDQVGPQSSPAAQGDGFPGAQPLSWCCPLPSAFITQIPPLPKPPAWKTILELSGLQSATWSLGAGVFVSGCGCCPFASMIQTCSLMGSPSWVTSSACRKAIFVPSGDHTGRSLKQPAGNEAQLVSACRPPPVRASTV